MRHGQFAILLTSIISVASIGRADGGETKLKNFKGPKVVEFHMVQSIGEDGFPRFTTSDSKGPIGEVSMSLRCSEGYHWEEIGKKRVPYAWNYHELFVLDSSAPSGKRLDAAARGQLEQGYHFSFKQSDCAKEPANMATGACTIKAELTMKTEVNKKTGASVPKASAKILDWSCKEPAAGSSGGTSETSRRTSP